MKDCLRIFGQFCLFGTKRVNNNLTAETHTYQENYMIEPAL